MNVKYNLGECELLPIDASGRPGTMLSVTRPKRPERTPAGKVKTTGRANVKYVALPIDLWEALLDIAEKNDRSISWVGRRAVRKYLESLKESGEPY